MHACAAYFIRVYKVLDSGRRLELMHKTAVEGGVVGALCAYKGRLLAGAGPVLRLHELGKKKLLRKCEYNRLPHHVATLHVQGSRIYVGDAQESVHLMKVRGAGLRIELRCDVMWWVLWAGSLLKIR